jgi:hypothetical protein
MNNKYIIINAETLRKKIEELEVWSKHNEKVGEYDSESAIISELKEILSNSIPLEREIEKAFEAGDSYRYWENNGSRSQPSDILNREDYINELKLEI